MTLRNHPIIEEKPAATVNKRQAKTIIKSEPQPATSAEEEPKADEKKRRGPKREKHDNYMLNFKILTS